MAGQVAAAGRAHGVTRALPRGSAQDDMADARAAMFGAATIRKAIRDASPSWQGGHAGVSEERACPHDAGVADASRGEPLRASWAHARTGIE